MIEPEIIEKISEIEDFYFPDNDSWSYSGFEIQTNNQIIRFLIDTSQCQFENYGYVCINDNIHDFVGAKILSISYFSKERTTMVFDAPYNTELKDAVFLDVMTDKGKLQFAVYNSHNGYYSHDIKIQSEQLTTEFYI